MKVLLVEDDASLREGMGELIAELAEVRQVGSVDAALVALREERFELVLADLRIAGSSNGGRTILEAARWRLQPVVIVSAAQEDEVREALLPFEADALLAKPFQLEDMTALIERFLALRRDAEHLSQERPAESGWTEAGTGVQVLRGQAASPLAASWVRMQPGASATWPLPGGRAGVLLVEGELEVEGERAPRYFFVSTGQQPLARTEQGCLLVSLALRG